MWISSTATCTGFLVFYPSPFPRMSLLHHINPAINPTSSRSRKRSLQSKVEKFRHAMLCFTLSENPHIELQIFTKTCRSEFGLLYCFEFVMQVSVPQQYIHSEHQLGRREGPGRAYTLSVKKVQRRGCRVCHNA